MSKQGLYVNGKFVCEVTDNSTLEVIPKSIKIGNSTMNQININGINIQAPNGGITINNSRIKVDGKEYNLDELQGDSPTITIEVYGNIKTVETANGELNINAQMVDTVSLGNGKIYVKANSVGSAKVVNGKIIGI